VIDIKPKVRAEREATPSRAESAVTNLVVRPGVAFDSVKVFAATKFTDRGLLGEVVTDWIAQNPDHQITEIAVRQSSDAEFHCLTMIVFYRAGR
jgi:hypothetical protein